MKLPLTPMALGATAAAAMPRNLGERAVNDSSKVLMSAPGRVMITDSSLSPTLDAPVAGNPSWVEFVKPNLLYAVDENSSDMRLFHLDLTGDKPSLSPVATAQGSAGVVHLAFNRDNTRMVGAAYGSAGIDVWDLTGEKLNLIKTIPSKGKLGPVKPNQAAAHPHQAVLDNSGRFFAVNDLGTDSVLLIDSKGDAYEQVQSASTPAGCGPRHGAFYPSGADKATHYMVACELSNEVIVFSLQYGDNDIAFTQSQRISTFDGNVPDGAAAGELAVTSNGDYLYVSNRLTGGDADSISRFTIDQDGKLKFDSSSSTYGVGPRHFSLSADDSQLFIANQDGPSAAVVLGAGESYPVASKLPISTFGGGESTGPSYIKPLA